MRLIHAKITIKKIIIFLVSGKIYPFFYKPLVLVALTFLYATYYRQLENLNVSSSF